MGQVFTSTHWRDSTRNILVNNERILYVERFEGELVSYTITFDNGQTLDLDEQTGTTFCIQLGRIYRAQPPIQPIRDECYHPPCLPRRIRPR